MSSQQTTDNIGRLLSLVSTTQRDERPAISLDGLLTELESLPGFGADSLRVAMVQIAARALETYLLADDVMLDLVRYPNSFLGRSEKVVRERLSVILGRSDLEPVLVKQLESCLVDGSGEREKTFSQQFVDEAFRRQGERHPRREVRCENCGYHFRRVDLKDGRLSIADSHSLVFSSQSDPRRVGDPLKPLKWTDLEIDHIIPTAGFGPTVSDNLRLTCKFCNGGKLAFRHSLEPLSVAIAGSLLAAPEVRSSVMRLEQIIVASAISSRTKCESCQRSVQDVELTVRQTQGSVVSCWLVPWNLSVICYDCYGVE